MAVTQNTYTGDGSTVLYNFTFPYLTQTDVKVKLDGATQATTEYSFANATTVEMDSAPGNGVKVIIYRDTDNDNKKATFYPGSAIKAEDLNNNIDQILYVAQEVDNNAMSSLGDTPMQGDMEFGQGMGIVFEGSTTDNFETRLAVADPTADRTITLPNVTGTVITTGDTGTVTSAMITDATIVNADINASAAIAQSKLNIANATTSAAGYQSAADKTKLDGIETAATADQTNAEIRAAVEAATDSNVFTDADHTKLNNIETAATADQTAAEIRTLVGDASNSNVFTDADNTKLAGIETAATADQTASEIKALIASSPLDASHLAADSVTTSELADAELTTLAGMQSGTASILADSTALTSTTTELNQLDGKTLGETTLTTNSDTAIPTSKAVNDRIVTVTNALGGFVAIADKDNFPTSHPDPGENAGTVVSISNAVGISVNSSGVGSLATRAGGSDAVVINGFPSALRGGATVGGATNANPYVLPANVGLQVQTTSTAHTYDYHKYLINEEDANKLSGDIQDFQERYRVSSSAPTSSLHDGDLYFDTTQNKMKVYNLSSTSWDDVATPGNFFISTLSPAFDGSTTQFTITNGPNSAQQIILSLNGVVQKPGTAFTLSGSTVTFASAPLSGSDYFAVVMGSAVNIGTPSNNTVSTAIIQNLAVTTGKIAADAVDGTKIADDAVGAEHIEVLDAALQFGDSVKAQFGASQDLEIYHDGNSNRILGTQNQLIYFGTNNTNRWAIMNDGHLQPEGSNTYNIGSGSAYIAATYSTNWYTPDSGKANFGASNDLQIYHSGSESWIRDVGTGNLYLDCNGDRISLISDGSEANGSMAKFIKDGGVELYYDNSLKFDTQSDGVKFYGQLYTNDANKIQLGNSQDLQIYHNGSHSYIDETGQGNLYVKSSGLALRATNFWGQNLDGTENHIQWHENGNVELYYDNIKTFETMSHGAYLYGPEGGTCNLYIYSDEGDDNADKWRIRNGDPGGSLTIQNYASGAWETSIECNGDGNVELYYDNGKRIETTNHGLKVTGNSNSPNGANWDTASSIITGGTYGGGIAMVDGSAGFVQYCHGSGANWELKSGATDATPETNIKATHNGTVELYYNNSLKIETYASGVKTTGNIRPTVDDTYHCGVSSAKWDNVYATNGTIQTSDRNEKNSIIESDLGLSFINKLKPVSYKWNNPKYQKTYYGLIAQDLEQTLSTEDKTINDFAGLDKPSDGPMGLNYSEFISPLIKAIQELTTKIETLETKVAALEAK